MSLLTGFMTLLAIVPLFSVLFMLIVRGGEKLSCRCLPNCPRPRA